MSKHTQTHKTNPGKWFDENQDKIEIALSEKDILAFCGIFQGALRTGSEAPVMLLGELMSQITDEQFMSDLMGMLFQSLINDSLELHRRNADQSEAV